MKSKWNLVQFSWNERQQKVPFNSVWVHLVNYASKWFVLKITHFFSSWCFPTTFTRRFGSSDIETSGKIEPENESDKKFTVSPPALIYLQTFPSQVFCATKLIGFKKRSWLEVFLFETTNYSHVLQQCIDNSSVVHHLFLKKVTL